MAFLLQLVFVLVLVLLNGFFVAAEFALVGVRKTRIEELVKKGSSAAKLVLVGLNDLESYISSTQLGITLSSLALGWIGEPAIAHFLEPFFEFLPDKTAFLTAHSLAVIIAFTFITILHIVLGELAPKTIALQSAEKTSLIVIAPLIVFTKICRPFIWLLNGAGSLVLKIFGYSAPSGHQLVHSEEEIKMILAQSAEGGTLEKAEVDMMHKVLKLGDIPVRSIMTPRIEIRAIAVETRIKDLRKIASKDILSRYPVYKGTIDTILGYVHVRDFGKIKGKEDANLLKAGIMRKVINVPDTQRIDDVLIAMRKKRVHLAVVNDEYGVTSGVVTLEDILESIVGEIYDEFDREEKIIRKQKDGKYLVDGLTPVQTIQQKFNIRIKGQGYVTIGGVVFGLLGREPSIGDTIQIGRLKIEIKEIEKKRIKTLILTKLKE